MSLCSAGHPQLHESLSRLVLSWSHSPCGFTALRDQTAWASAETESTLRKCVQVEKALAGLKDTCVLVLLLPFTCCLHVKQFSSAGCLHSADVTCWSIFYSSCPRVGAGEQPGLWLLFLSKPVLPPGSIFSYHLKVWKV